MDEERTNDMQGQFPADLSQEAVESDAKESVTEPASEDLPETEEPQKKFCGGCGAELTKDEKFCPKCGKMQTPPVQSDSVATFNQGIEEKKKKKKKKKLIVLAAIVVAIALCFAGKFAFVKIRHSVGISKADSTVEKYKNEKLDYDSAAAIIEKLALAKDVDVADHAKSAKKSLDALKASFEHFDKGESYKAKKDYENAVLHYEKVSKEDPHYEKAQNRTQEIIPAWKKTISAQVEALVKDKKLSDANELVKLFLTYSKDDKEIQALGNYLKAEDFYATGHLNSAKDVYDKLPADLAVNGVTVASRLETLEKYATFVKMCGKWKTTKLYAETRETDRWSGGSTGWNVDDDDVSNEYLELECTCIINEDGTVTVKGFLKYFTFTNYSAYKSNLNSDFFTTKFEKSVSLPGDGKVSISYVDNNIRYAGSTIDENNTVSFDGKVFTFKNRSEYISSHYWKYNWKNDVTFGECVEKY